MSSTFPESPFLKGISVHLYTEPSLVFIQPFKPKNPTSYYSAMPPNAFGIQSTKFTMTSVAYRMTSVESGMTRIDHGMTTYFYGVISVGCGMQVVGYGLDH